MRAITIRQPWASMIVLGLKCYETRSRGTQIRGRVAIHAGAKCPIPLGENYFFTPDVEVIHAIDGLWLDAYGVREPLPLGAVVGTANLTDCHPSQLCLVTPLEARLGDFTCGRSAWEMSRPMLFDEPIPAKGKQGWWEWETTA